MKAKQTAFIAMMSALGLLLSTLSLSLAPQLAAVGQGGAALDLSHIATFIAAIFGGPYVGAIVGFVSGIYAGYYFGYILGTLGLLSLIGVPLGKALTGFFAGLISRKINLFNQRRTSLLTVPVVLISYIPECLFTIAYFLYIVMYSYGYALAIMLPIVIPKAWIEIGLMSIVMGALIGNVGFRNFISTFFSENNRRVRNEKSEPKRLR